MVPGGFAYDVARGRLGDIRLVPNSVHLGAIVCLAAGLTAPSTLGAEDPELPAIGEGFFYVAEYDDGHLSEYGTEETALPRIATDGYR